MFSIYNHSGQQIYLTTGSCKVDDKKNDEIDRRHSASAMRGEPSTSASRLTHYAGQVLNQQPASRARLEGKAGSIKLTTVYHILED